MMSLSELDYSDGFILMNSSFFLRKVNVHMVFNFLSLCEYLIMIINLLFQNSDPAQTAKNIIHYL